MSTRARQITSLRVRILTKILVGIYNKWDDEKNATGSHNGALRKTNTFLQTLENGKKKTTLIPRKQNILPTNSQWTNISDTSSELGNCYFSYSTRGTPPVKFLSFQLKSGRRSLKVRDTILTDIYQHTKPPPKPSSHPPH